MSDADECEEMETGNYFFVAENVIVKLVGVELWGRCFS